jgi:hypothetical protein
VVRRRDHLLPGTLRVCASGQSRQAVYLCPLERELTVPILFLQVAQILKAILQGPPKAVGSNSRRWLEVHASRTVLCDIPAFICFLLAVMS